MPEQPLLLRIEEVCRLCGIGETKCRELIKESGAGRKLGRSFRVDRKKFFDYIDTLTAED